MAIEIVKVTTKKQLKAFIFLPAKLHKNDKLWVPPVYMDEKIYFNPQKNKSFNYSDTILMLAYKNGKVSGRIMGLINFRYNEIQKENNARFCYFEGYEDTEVATALLNSIENWAKEKKMNRLIGPFGFSDKDPQGFLIEGYDQLPVIASNYNSTTAPAFMEFSGYEKEVDLFVYKLVIPKELPDFYKVIFDRITKNSGFSIKEYSKRKDLKKDIRPIFTLINETFTDIYGFMPFEQKEMDDFASRYLAVIKPQYVKSILKDNQIIAFIIGMPDISLGVQKAKGYVFPYGFVHIFNAQKKTKRLSLLLGAIKSEYRGRGLDVLLGTKLIESARTGGFEYIDSHLELENNTVMRSEMEKMGGVVYKKFRVFGKNLTP